MYDIDTTREFEDWLDGLRDLNAKARVAKRIQIMSTGTLGNTRPLTGGLFEAKIHYGPGYRLYFVTRGKRIIVLLCGGDKSTQKQDIKKAKELAKEL
ncbi:MAG: type II toxin-antitoxin system RelE/ParE family toxin [Spirochaetales bacterium]|jgi:putative addiction module killer protein|nr:type II toxin-antitoxin system RelE/ParE family toxin [Spirochaetales bacterium]